jgi:hypothetical protein
MSGDPLLFKALLSGGRLCRSSPDGGFLHRFHGRNNFLSAVGQTVHAAHASFVFAGVVFVEGGVYPLQHGHQRDAGLAPGFDQCPVDGGKQQQRSSAALEVFFNLSKVFEKGLR